ncbi:uncharacterized protein METZ01_LOCUS409481, partial [marine metagenome]
VGLNVVERVNLFQQYHLLGLPELTCLDSRIVIRWNVDGGGGKGEKNIKVVSICYLQCV